MPGCLDEQLTYHCRQRFQIVRFLQQADYVPRWLAQHVVQVPCQLQQIRFCHGTLSRGDQTLRGFDNDGNNTGRRAISPHQP